MKVSSSLVLKVGQAYEGLGPLVKRLPNGILHYDCQRWRNSVMSPMLLTSARLTPRDLQKIAAYHRAPYLYDSKRPYVQFLGGSAGDNKANHELLRRQGWTKQAYATQNTVNIWTRPIPLELPKGIEMRVARYFDPRVRRDFLKLMKANFNLTSLFLSELEKMHSLIEPRLRTVVLYNAKKTAVATGLVAVGKKGSHYLYCGSVAKQARGQGLWRVLVAARQAASLDGHADSTWVTTTANKRIRGKGDINCRMIVYQA
ncbi:MAG: hypothetical protein AB7F86_17135 [Bdellovibrionales bacterium]